MIHAKVTKVNKAEGFVVLRDEAGNQHISEQLDLVFSAKRGQEVKIKESRLVGQVMLATVTLN